MYTLLGPSQSTVLRTAMIAGDEEKAIEAYTKDSKGKPIEVLMNPSSPFEAKRFHETTPLHLAALMCFDKLIDLFLLNNGNPNILNAKHETSLHTLCSKGDFPELRAKVLQKFIDWKGSVGNSNSLETVSLNRVDDDGNAAIHHAAINGLELCVELLVRSGAITSIVNFSQRTCCELADINSHKELGTMIELALVYQPDDDTMIAFRLSQTESNASPRRIQNQPSPVTLTIDSISMRLADIDEYISSLIYQVCVFVTTHFSNETLIFSKISIAPSRAEVLLNTGGWDYQEVENELTKDREAFLKLAHLSSEVQYTYIYENDTIAPPNMNAIDINKASSSMMKLSSSIGNSTRNNTSSNSSSNKLNNNNVQQVNNISTGIPKPTNTCKFYFILLLYLSL